MESLGRADLSPATCRGYRYDLRHFLGWRATSQPEPLEVATLTEVDLVTYRQGMIAAGLRPATVNRRLEALRRLCRWAQEAHTLAGDITRDIRPVRCAVASRSASPTPRSTPCCAPPALRPTAWLGATTPSCS